VECGILAEIERRSGKTIPDLFDMAAGTSGGGIIIESIGAGHSAQETMDFFQQDGPNIFADGLLSGNIGLILRGYRYPAAPLEDALQKRLGIQKMADSKMSIIVPAVDRITGQTIFFKSFDNETMDYPMWQVARATSAAQTYFPAYPLGPWSLWDGGNACNNPAMCCYADAVARWGNGEQYRMLSLGCGDPAAQAVPVDPSAVTILKESLALLLGCNDQIPEYQLSKILGSQFVSLQAQGITTGLADASPAALASLEGVLQATITEMSEEIDMFCSR
jgi:hypothetical protein